MNTPIKSTARVPIHVVEVVVPTLGTAKILYMRELRLFAMYVRTEPVHTYIAKSPKHAIYNPQNTLYTQFFMVLKWLWTFCLRPRKLNQVVKMTT